MTYATLKSDIAAWMHRSDLTSVIPSFVSLAEEEIYKSNQTPLRVREMETEADLTVTSLTATLPTDYLESRYIKQDNSDARTIFYRPPENWLPTYTGYFTIVGDEIRLPTGYTSNLKLVYYAKPAALSADGDTNAVLENYYSAYLKASLKQAHIYTKNTQEAIATQQEVNAILQNANARNKAAHSGALTVRAG